MNFEKLWLSARSDGTIRGHVEFKNELGTVELNLDDKLSKEVMAVCADALVRVSKQAAEEMSAQVLEGLGIELIEATPSDKETPENE